MRRYTDFDGVTARAVAILLSSALAVFALATLTALGVTGTRTYAQQQPTAQPPELTPTTTPTPWPQTSACALRLSKVALPGVVQLGGTVQITLTARADCPSEATPLHVMLLLDGSSSMAGNPTRQMKDAALVMVDRFKLADNPSIQIGVVEINLPPLLRCPPSSDTNAVKACIRQVGASGGTDIAGAIDLGREALEDSRNAMADQRGLQQAIVIVTDGANNAGCSPVLTAAREAKSQGIINIAVAVGNAADTQCLRQAASSARYFYMADDPGALIAVFERIRRDLLDIKLRQILVNDTLPANMAYVPDSAEPPADLDAFSKQLTWDFRYVPRDGITMTFKVRPLEAGQHPTNAGATAAIRDMRDDTGLAVFPTPMVMVIGDPVAPTITPTPASPDGSSALAVANPRPRRGEQSRVSFNLRFDPPELPARTHVALVADASGSMSGENNTQLKAGLRALVERMAEADPEAWKAAVVEFDSIARGLCGFSSDLETLRHCIGLIGASGGTRIDLGMDMGLQVLRAGRPAPGHEDLVVFTDGANSGGCPPVLDRANAAKAEGIEVHMVCLGTACDTVCMRTAASSPGHYHEAPDADGLPRTFDRVADRLVGDRRVAGTVLRLQLPASLRLVAGSASLPPSEASDQAATWDLAALPLGASTLDFAFEAIDEQPGRIHMAAETQFLNYPPLVLTTTADVLTPDGAPVPSPTPTLSSTTPPAPTSTSPTSTPGTPPATATSKLDDQRGKQLYLPLAVREACPGDTLDLVLVLDTSNSMAERAIDGGSKLDAAVAAAEALLGALRLPADQVGLVSFNQTARLVSPLSGDRTALLGELRRLALGNGTALDQGLARAREALAGPDRRPAGRRLILLLTDGRSTTPAADAIAQAAAAKADGITIHAIGLGNEVDARTLGGIASTPAHYRAAAGRAAVIAAFEAVARSERCRGAFWAGR